jgi:hypothetical protein
MMRDPYGKFPDPRAEAAVAEFKQAERLIAPPRQTLGDNLNPGQLRQLGKGKLVLEILRLRGLLDEEAKEGMEDLLLLAQAKQREGKPQQPGAVPNPRMLHKEAFMLMTYISEGGTMEMKIWNSRDGVTPFQIHVDGVQYTHDIPKMAGPFFDRPEGCVAQWETRTEMAMMAAWERALNRAVLAGKMSKQKAEGLVNLPDAARGNNLNIGLRSMATGRFTDEAA